MNSEQFQTDIANVGRSRTTARKIFERPVSQLALMTDRCSLFTVYCSLLALLALLASAHAADLSTFTKADTWDATVAANRDRVPDVSEKMTTADTLRHLSFLSFICLELPDEDPKKHREALRSFVSLGSGLLVRLGKDRQSPDVQLALKSLTEAMGRGPVLWQWSDLMCRFCAAFPAATPNAVEALLAQGKFVSETGRAGLTYKAAMLLERQGELEKALDVLQCFSRKNPKSAREPKRMRLGGKLSGNTKKLLRGGVLKKGEIARKTASIRLRLKYLATILREAMGLKDTLQLVDNAVKAGEYDAATSVLMRALNKENDSVMLDDDRSGKGAVHAVHEKLAGAPDEFRAHFMRGLDRAASAAVEGGDVADEPFWCRTMSLYQGSRAATRGAMNVAAWLMDRGEASRAALWYRELWRSRQDPGTAALAAYAMALAGDGEGFKAFRRSLSPAQLKRPVMLRGSKVPLVRAVGAFQSMLPPPPKKGVLFEDGLSVPGWTSFLTANDVARCRMGWNPSAPITCVPARHGADLFLNTDSSVVCHEITSGKVRWAFRLPGSGGELKGAPPVVLGVCVGAERVFARLRMNLYALSASSGKRLWSARSNRGLRASRIVSDPLLSDGALFVMVSEDAGSGAGLSAAALSASTGKLLWKRTLVSGYSTLDGESIVLELPRPTRTPDGVVFSTNMGLVASANPLTGAIRWVHRYPRSGSKVAGADVRRIPPNKAMTDGRSVFLAPRDYPHLLCLEAAMGRLKWSVPIESHPILTGMWENSIILVGSSGVRLLSRERGVESRRIGSKISLDHIRSVVDGQKLLLFSHGWQTGIDLKTGTAKASPIAKRYRSCRSVFLNDYAVVFHDYAAYTVLGRDRKLFSPRIAIQDARDALRAGESKKGKPNRMPTSLDHDDRTEWLVLQSERARRSGDRKAAAGYAKQIHRYGSRKLIHLGDTRRVNPLHLARVLSGNGADFARVRKLSPLPATSRPVEVWKAGPSLGKLYFPPDFRDVFVTCAAGQVHLRRLTGAAETLWSAAQTGVQHVRFTGERIILLTDNGAHGLDLSTGERLWQHGAGKLAQNAGLFGGRLYFPSADHRKLVCADVRNGKVLSESPLPSKWYFNWIHSHGKHLFVGLSMHWRQPWKVVRVDPRTGTLAKKACFDLGRARPVALGRGVLVAQLGLDLFATDLPTGKELWRTKLDKRDRPQHHVFSDAQKKRFFFWVRGAKRTYLTDFLSGERLLTAGHQTLMANGKCDLLTPVHRGVLAIRRVVLGTKGKGAKTLWTNSTAFNKARGDVWLLTNENTPKALQWTSGSDRSKSQKVRLLEFEPNTGELLNASPSLPVPRVKGVHRLYGGRLYILNTEGGTYCLKLAPYRPPPRPKPEASTGAKAKKVKPGKRGK